MFDWFSKKVEEETPIQKAVTPRYQDPDKIIAFFKNETGVTFEKQRSIITQKLATFCRTRNINAFDACYEMIQNDTLLKQELINYLTTNESYFYREFAQIETLVDLAKHKSETITILCAPCATGEEPYSLAIALLEGGRAIDTFKITGIDINSEALKKAEAGIYNERSVRNLSDTLLQRYFHYENDLYRIDDRVKTAVNFAQMNLFDYDFTKIGKFDFVFSRNMLIYFDKATKARAKTILESVRKDRDVPVFFGHADLF